MGEGVGQRADAVSPRRVFGWVAVAEAITWALLLTGMFLKYVTETTEMGVSIAGPVHGFVFLLFVVTVVVVAVDQFSDFPAEATAKAAHRALLKIKLGGDGDGARIAHAPVTRRPVVGSQRPSGAGSPRSSATRSVIAAIMRPVPSRRVAAVTGRSRRSARSTGAPTRTSTSSRSVASVGRCAPANFT